MPVRKAKEEVEMFRVWLRQNGLKRTYQKELILETFLGAEGHLSVDDIYTLVKKKDRRVGSVTVFRTLKSLAACGIAREVTLGDGLTRFEHGHRHPPHHHIVCTRCGRVIEFASPELERMQDEIMRKYDFQPDRHWIKTCGVCSNCRENRKGGEERPCDTERVFARDAVKMALATEVRLMEFFQQAAAANQDAAGREVFERIARLKEANIATLGEELDDVVRGEEDVAKAPVFLHFSLDEVEQNIPSLTRLTARPPAQGGRPVVEMALDAEAAAKLARFLTVTAATFFKDYAAKFPDTRGRRILLGFAGQQESHGDLDSNSYLSAWDSKS
ncbi:MAG: transcriptional repressor [Acidobacteriota bacterium]|jgi:Fur family ferric uptake transcriptional regulator|nr:transcriptional repressor [Acidobacteriota bacterium]